MNEEPPQPAASPESESSNSVKLDYELLRLIGRGAYGEVWLARDKAGKYRAVKVVFRESFDHDRPYEREYQGICKFEPVSRYDNQVQILHVGRQDEAGRFYYIMELADDQRTGQDIDPKTYVPKTIKSEMQKQGRFSVQECLRIGTALAGALENLHQHGLIHRDIKPANIIFVNGVPKLADIGLVTDRDVSVSYVGTEGYIPPEGPSSAQADIYSLGKVLYEMATGRDRMDFPELPTNLEELPDREALLELNAIIAKACARDPRRRYQSARKMFAALARLQTGKPIRRSVLAWTKLAAAATVIALLAILGVISYHFYHSRPATESASQQNVTSAPQPAIRPPAIVETSPLPPPAVEAPKPSTVEDGFISLFNGRDLTGWTGDRRFWSVDNGTILGRSTTANAPAENTFLIWTNGTLADFELRLSFKITAGNSGVQYRSKEISRNSWRVQGYQVDIDIANGPYLTGTLYEEGGRRGTMAELGQKVVWETRRKREVTGQTAETREQLKDAIKVADWNELAVIATGDHLIHKINGHVCIDVIDANVLQKSSSGILAFQLHQQPPVTVQFKDIRLKQFNQNAMESLPTPKGVTWTRLFEDRTLSGWTPTAGTAWAWANGAVSCASTPGYLFSRDIYTNLEFRASIRLSPGANGGMYFRAQEVDNRNPVFAVRGYEAQASNTDKANRFNGSLYNFVDISEHLVPDGVWFTQHVIAVGNRIIIKVNERIVVDYVDPKNTWPSGHLALQQMNKGKPISYRDVMVKRLPSDPQLAWAEARKGTPALSTPGQP